MGRTNDALDRLFELQTTCRQVLENLQNDLNEDATEVDMIPEDRKGAGNIVFFKLQAHRPYANMAAAV